MIDVKQFIEEHQGTQVLEYPVIAKIKQQLDAGKPVNMALQRNFEEFVKEYGEGCTMADHDRGLIAACQKFNLSSLDSNTLGTLSFHMKKFGYNTAKQRKLLIEIHERYSKK
jgi:hypothetical protein